MEYSKYQVNVFNSVETGTNNLVISAVAGSGKTTTLVEVLKIIKFGKSILFLSFNKSIQEEIEKRVPSHVRVKTFHGLGLSYIKNTYPSMVFDKFKISKYSEKFIEPYVKINFPRKQINSVLSEYSQLINVFRNNALEIPEVLDRKNIDKTLENVYNIQSTNFNFEYISSDDDHIRAIKTLGAMNEDRKIYDFNDMIYLPVIDQNIKNNIIPYDYVLVDECQDLNYTQQKFMDNMLKEETGRFIAVGDPRQAIYAFAGADIHSFNNLINKPNTITLPLSYCYRCGKNMIKYAKGFVDQIEAVETKYDGIIRDGNENDIKEGDIVLSRFNKNLITLFFKLLKNKKKSYIKGKDIGDNLINLITKSGAKNVGEFDKFTETEIKKIKLKLEAKMGRILDKEMFEDSHEYQIFYERIECIKFLHTNYIKQIKTFQDLKEKISTIFLDEGEGIMLSTTHKAKGLENDRVIILDAYLFPAQYAKEEHEKIQEQNLYYVAITRAKNELIFINESFDRKMYRYLLFNEFDNIRSLAKTKGIDLENGIYFIEDIQNFKFDFTANYNKVFSYYKNEGFTTLKELENKYKKIINGKSATTNCQL